MEKPPQKTWKDIASTNQHMTYTHLPRIFDTNTRKICQIFLFISGLRVCERKGVLYIVRIVLASEFPTDYSICLKCKVCTQINCLKHQEGASIVLESQIKLPELWLIPISATKESENE